MRSSTEVCLRNRASAAGSRDRSSRRKYSDTNRSSPAKPAALAELGAPACIDSAARYRPAGQPSVRSVSSESSLGVELDSRRLQQQLGLLLVQPEVRHADLVHQSLRPPAGERQRRLLPARDRDLRAGRDVLEQRREHVQAGRVGDGVQIVEHQHQRALERGQRAPDARDALRPGRSARARQRVEHLGRDRLDAVDRGRDVAQEHHGVVVSAVERDPRERTRIGLGPLREQRRLAVPGGRDHGRERHGRRAQPRDHVRLRHGAGPGRRRSELDLRRGRKELPRRSIASPMLWRCRTGTPRVPPRNQPVNHPVGMRRRRRRTPTLSAQSHQFSSLRQTALGSRSGSRRLQPTRR